MLATFRDIRRCKGDLKKLEETVKMQEFKNDVQRRWKLRFIWDNNVIYSTPEEMKESEGGMENLVEICRTKENKERRNKNDNKSPEKKRKSELVTKQFLSQRIQRKKERQVLKRTVR